nr:N-acyl-D-glucosamine 2-epimerase [Paenibacillus hamazuiensis]
MNRTEDSIADEIELAGYGVVRYFVTNEYQVNGRLVEAFRRRGIKVWAMTLGNGTYTTDHLPKEWPDWQMTLLKPVKDGFWRFSPFSYKYVKWKKEVLAGLVRRYPFDGLEIAEPYFPEWNGLSSGVYGDVGPLARLAFKTEYGVDMPDFRHVTSPIYYLNNKERYRWWVQFRVDAVNRFLHELVNGFGGVRDVRPDIRIATWSIAVQASGDPVELVREYQGVDAAAMITRVKPDVHFIQTHWPDWMRGWLKPDYIKAYQPFAEQIRAVHRDIPLGVQADIGSIRKIRRSLEWVDKFAAAAQSCGYATWTAYEYHLGKYMYDEKPVPLKAVRTDRQAVQLSFSKRIDPESASDERNYEASADGRRLSCAIGVAEVDGNRAVLHSDDFPAGGFRLYVRGVKDTPSLWLVKDGKVNEVPSGAFVTVPAWNE